MSLALGLKGAQTVYTIGSKLAMAHALGQKLGQLGRFAYNKYKGNSVGKNMETNNLIENKQTLGDLPYIPMGVKKIAKIAKMADDIRKKSYLEKPKALANLIK